MPVCSRGSAFTLIELLIVVAIIGILAAIAIPNFQAARIRAQVARVKADLRNIAVAYDSYRVDEGRYPPYGLRHGYHFLTTPNAYLSSDGMSDPFAIHEEHLRDKQYRVYLYDGIYETNPVHYSQSPQALGKKSVVVSSYGPDNEDNRFFHVLRVGWSKGTEILTYTVPYTFVYMSSNGVRSEGDIGRIVGDLPPGIPASIGGVISTQRLVCHEHCVRSV